MRTTLTIDDDVLEAARAVAARDGRGIGEVISDLARRSLTGPAPKRKRRNGIPLLPVNNPGAIVTLETVNRLRDTLP